MQNNKLCVESFQRCLIGIRLREERKRLRLSQAELSEIGGVSKRTQIDYEKGRYATNADYLVRIHNAADVDINYILTGARTKPLSIEITEKQRARLVSDIRSFNLPEPQRDAMTDCINLIIDRLNGSIKEGMW